VDREAELREFVAARGAALSRAAFLLTGNHQAAEDLV
jgi:DNA-directed RNA polymerase specialized sigma24 family protein